jgi:nucleoside 2-deoxyribosyltransferase
MLGFEGGLVVATLEQRCFIWGTHAVVAGGALDAWKCVSARAGGSYEIMPLAVPTVRALELVDKVKLTDWLVEQRAIGEDLPRIDVHNISGILDRPRLAVRDRADRLLQFIARLKPEVADLFDFALTKLDVTISSWVEDDVTSQMKAFSGSSLAEAQSDPNKSDVVYLLEYLESEGFVKRLKHLQHTHRHERGFECSNAFEYLITPKGHSRVAELKGRMATSSQAFVAMWFDPTMTDAYELGLKLGIKDAGFTALRVDSLDHNGKIDDRIIAEIRRSRFVVADFTQKRSGARGGVYYEAGFAQGLGMPVIFTCRKDSIRRVHFDTRQYNHIVWQTPSELRERLSARISATIGDGPEKR